MKDNTINMLIVLIVALVGIFVLTYDNMGKEDTNIAGSAFSYNTHPVNLGYYIYGYFKVEDNSTNSTIWCNYTRSNYDPFMGGYITYIYNGNCTDTDEGFYPYIYGSLIDRNGTQVRDTCYDNKTLIEVYCHGNGDYLTETIPCTFGCSNGRCLTGNETSDVFNLTITNSSNDTIYNCTDSDMGIDVYEYGHTDDIVGKHYDYCSSSVDLVEHYCSEYGDSRTTTIRCGYMCQNGKCIDKETSRRDYCSGNTLHEFSCGYKEITETVGECSLGCVSDVDGSGKCVERKWIAGVDPSIYHSTK